jgi:polysaccharide export outer membrane protein
VVRFAAIAGLLAIGCFGRTLSPPPPDPTPTDRVTYTIGVTDVLKIAVWKNPELSSRVPVRPDGMVSVPLINDVQAEGLTPEELKEVIASRARGVRDGAQRHGRRDPDEQPLRLGDRRGRAGYARAA